MTAFRCAVAGRDAIFVSLMAVAQPLDLTRCGLAAMFDLTNSERQIAQMLVNLNTPREISEVLGVSINTVRTHIRGIYTKLSISSQRELLRLASAFCMVCRGPKCPFLGLIRRNGKFRSNIIKVDDANR